MFNSASMILQNGTAGSKYMGLEKSKHGDGDVQLWRPIVRLHHGTKHKLADPHPLQVVAARLYDQGLMHLRQLNQFPEDGRPLALNMTSVVWEQVSKVLRYTAWYRDVPSSLAVSKKSLNKTNRGQES